MQSPARYGKRNPFDPVYHELPPFRYGNDQVPVRIAVRRDEDGAWRGRLVFGVGDPEGLPATAEIFCAAHEADLWQAVRDLGDYHLGDLYRSLSE